MNFDPSVLKYNEQGLIPAVAQDAASGQVLMLAYMNAESVQQTRATGYATYYSRSRQQLWKKGETSGHTQRVLAMAYDCDADALLLTVEQIGPACHTGEKSCFHHPILPEDPDDAPATPAILQAVYDTITDRRAHPQDGSYTNYLFDKGVEKMCKKLGEEASETIIAAMKGNRTEVTYEAADLLYHLLVLLHQEGVTPSDVWAELQRRR